MTSRPRRISKPRRRNAAPLTDAPDADAPLDGDVMLPAPRGGTPAGEPRKYDDREFPRAARFLCKLGATNADLADFFGVTIQSIINWQSFFPRFNAALRVGKGEFDAQIERSLAMRAVGYTYDAVKIFLPAGAAAPVVVPYREHVPPDVAACSLWLRNRKQGEWRDTQDRRMSGSVSVTVSPEEASY